MITVDFGQNFNNHFHFSESIKSKTSKLEKQVKTKDSDYNILLNEKQSFFLYTCISICSTGKLKSDIICTIFMCTKLNM